MLEHPCRAHGCGTKPVPLLPMMPPMILFHRHWKHPGTKTCSPYVKRFASNLQAHRWEDIPAFTALLTDGPSETPLLLHQLHPQQQLNLHCLGWAR